MSISLYHCRDTRSLRPLWTLEELGLSYELVNMEFPPRYTHTGYLDINPLGTVPTMIIDGLTMTESTAMSQYLVERFAPTDLGLDLAHPDYPLYLNWLHRADATFAFPLTLILRYSFFEEEARRQPQIVEDYTKWFLSRLRSLEDALTDRDYLVADRFTIADICVGYAVILAKKLKFEDKFGVNTLAYLDRITSRKGYQRARDKQSELKAFF